MTSFFVYLFWPNPGGWTYSSSAALSLLVLSILLIVSSFAISRWRASLHNPRTRLLSRSWSSASLWFGVSALVLVVSRVESIQFIAMRVLWILWLFFLAAFVVFQVVQFRRRHYTIAPPQRVIDQREKYLPKAKQK